MVIEGWEVETATFLDEMRVGEMVSAGPFPAARKDPYRLEVSFGGRPCGRPSA